MAFPGVLKEEYAEIPGVQLKKKLDFQGYSTKTHVESPCFLVFDLEISNGCHTILENFQEWKLVFSKISKSTVTN